MALTLEYRNTFIDIKEDAPEADETCKVRAQSSPPGRTRRISFTTETAQEEDAMRTYVCSLSQTAADFVQHAWPEPDPSTSLSDDSAESADVRLGFALPPELLPSIDSLGHPEACRRPCIYFISGHCANGEACAYCHLTHTEKVPKLDKKQRVTGSDLAKRKVLESSRCCRLELIWGWLVVCMYQPRSRLDAQEDMLSAGRYVAFPLSMRSLRRLPKSESNLYVSLTERSGRITTSSHELTLISANNEVT